MLVRAMQRPTDCQSLVELQFNALYDETGCIETGEASEVISRVEQLARLVGLSNDDEALTGHRDW